jgi:hypothetical protein
MRHLYIALGVSAAAAVAFGWAFYMGVDWHRDRQALDAAQDYITGTEDARDAQDTVPDDQPSIVDWLLRFQSD